ncbi:hypothetical protein [Saccharothrix coeruleofusca]|uniref:Polyketide cyclase/dehydrase/lipid transport protein n=1 Tax=Saccharothrix coeruleofusca TaxID=33919 RepID=A0A918EI97_9PSEU|nr:hypothetical protein [Saccharothrix coeruleofusca]GGP84368.1 hypothetical protein GCM10010185_67750 [Saccharothrix coeruleofusca]
MTPARARRDIAALPDLVFATAAEPERLASWLPEPLGVLGRNDDVLILSCHDKPRQYRLAADFDRLLLVFQPLAEDGCGARLRVELAGAAGSVAELELDRPDGELAARLLEALGKEVERAFTDG